MRSESETDYADSWNIIFKYETTVLVNCILNAVFMLTSVLENSLVLAAILRTPSLRSPSIIFLCSLASSDLFVGLVVQPVYIAYHLTESTTVYQVLSIMAGSGCGFSLLVMTAITVDRFLALHYPMQYPNLVTAHRAFSISVTLWIISILLSLCLFWKMEAYHFAAAVSIAICLLLSSACYVRIYRIVQKHQFQIHVQHIAVEKKPSWKYWPNCVAICQGCQKHFYILHRNDFVLHPVVCFHVNFSHVSRPMDDRLDISRYRSVYELLYQPISVLLATSRDSNGSCKNSKADVMQKKDISVAVC